MVSPAMKCEGMSCAHYCAPGTAGSQFVARDGGEQREPCDQRATSIIESPRRRAATATVGCTLAQVWQQVGRLVIDAGIVLNNDRVRSQADGRGTPKLSFKPWKQPFRLRQRGASTS